jgi:ATP-binding cassette subfamily F protein uup
VLIVSHDRTFLDNVVTQSIVFEGDGKLTEIVGGYGDWLDWKQRQSQSQPQPVKAEAPKPAVPKSGAKSKLSYKESRELAELPARIAALEVEQAALAEKLDDPGYFECFPGEAAIAAMRFAAIDDELLEILIRQETLGGKQV